MPTGVRTATVVRKPKVDKLSAPSTAQPVEKALTGLIILPREAFEEGKGWVTYEGWDVYIMPTSRVTDLPDGQPRPYADGDVVSTDILEIDGIDWQVDGPPAPYDKGSARKATRVRVKKVGS